MNDDVDDLLLLVGVFFALHVGARLYRGASRIVNAAQSISKEVQRFQNLGLTNEEDERAQKTILDPNASIADKRAAAATLRTKVETAKGMSPIAVAQLRPLDKALELYLRELDGQDELAEKRAKWEAEQAAAKN